MKKYLALLSAVALLGSCVPTKRLKQSMEETAGLRSDSSSMANRISGLQTDISNLNARIDSLNKQNNQLGQMTAEQQSMLAANRNKLSESQNQLNQSKLTLEQQQARLQNLQNLLNQQKEQSNRLRNKMAEALKGFSQSDLTVSQKNGKVYVSLSENLLFPSGSAVVNPKGVDALSKLAAVLVQDSTVAVNIEGHTDSIPIRGRYKDNWDLSTARATAIVRILVDSYQVDPLRVIASGHSYFDPVDSNATAEGRAKNRRTDIILSPKLEEMYKLLQQ